MHNPLWIRPKISILTDKAVEDIISEAMTLLAKVGVTVDNREARELLADHGADVQGQQVRIPTPLVEKCCETVPSSITLYDRSGNEAAHIGGDEVNFDPGSAALNLLESDGRTVRKPVTEDLEKFATLVDRLDYFALQATSLICADVPLEIQDRYRLFLVLRNCSKPVVTGTFHHHAFAVMKEMLIAVRGTEEALRAKPLAIFDCCPSSPLKWSDLTAHDLMEAARAGIPAELVGMPLSGAAAPVTLIGTLVQHTIEDLSGIVIHQLTQPGSPIIYGGSPSIMDMTKGTTPMGAIETMMIDTAYARIGKYFGFPTHAYMGLSDAKTFDYQSGLESGMGALMAALGGVNVVSGGGMLDFESCQSFEKLVYDNEIAGMALRLTRGIEPTEKPFAREFFDETFDGNFLASPRTFDLFQKEFYFPSKVIDRSTQQEWAAKGKRYAGELARERIAELLTAPPNRPAPEVEQALEEIINGELQRMGVTDKLWT